MTPKSKQDAYALLREMGAPAHLLRHVALVGEAAELLLAKFRELRIPIDEDFVRVGVALHDTGKIKHPQELAGPGSLHEPQGEGMLLAVGVSPEVARICLSHARWTSMQCSLEELLVALSDKLWKGVRRADLEESVVKESSLRLGVDYWDLFLTLDSCFEGIADEGSARLQRSTELGG